MLKFWESKNKNPGEPHFLKQINIREKSVGILKNKNKNPREPHFLKQINVRERSVEILKNKK